MIPRNVQLINLSQFFVALRFFAAIQVIYFAQVTGSYALAMSIFAVGTVSQAILEIPTGIYSDKVGRRTTLILGAFFGAISVVFYAIGQAFTVLLLGALVQGLARALGSGNNDALMYDSLREAQKEDEYSHFLGRREAMSHFGFGVAALLGGFLATISFSLALWLSVFFQFVAFVITLFIV